MKLKSPTFLSLSIGLPFTLYGWRLRTKLTQELLAAAGIAVGVALVFGVLVANTSIGGSANSLVHQLVGTAQLQLAARSESGISSRIAGEAERLPGVEVASPVLRENLTVIGPRRAEPIQLIGVTASQLKLSPTATQDLGSRASLLISGGIGLPLGVAQAVGAHTGQTVTLRAAGHWRRVHVRAVLGSQIIGAVADSPIAIALLATAQELTGKHGRVTNVLIKASPGDEAKVASELRRLAGGYANVTTASNDLRLLNTAATPNKQSTTLFAAIAGMVGFLLAVNAMLLTVPERRRLVAELRTFGYDPIQITVIVAFQALILGLIGSALGIVLGNVLSRTLFAKVPSYLTVVFPIGSQKIITVHVVLIAVGCGVVAALLASLRPLFDLRAGRAIDTVIHEQGESGQSIPRNVAAALAATGITLIVAATVLAYTVPTLTIAGGVLLAVAAVCALPTAYMSVIRVLRPLGEHSKGVLSIAIIEMEATATRSTALAAIAALAVYGSIAIGGARADLTRGLETAIHQDSDPAQLWVTTGDNVFNTDSFDPRRVKAAIMSTSVVASVRADQGALLNVGTRRLLIRGHSANIPTMIQSSQLLEGSLGHATELLRRGGWATVSEGFAKERNLGIGTSFSLPTPSGTLPLRVAAITTNLGWPAGAVTFSSADYSRGWKTADPSAYEVGLRPGVSLNAGRHAVTAALRPFGLVVQTFREREAEGDHDLSQGLSSLGQIATLLLITGAIAVAASLAAAIWQRRPRLAAMKTWGYDELQLWRSLLLECAILLAIGCATGAILGVYGHALADRWLKLTTDFPAPFALGADQALLCLALVALIAFIVIAVPGFRAARVPAALSFQE